MSKMGIDTLSPQEAKRLFKEHFNKMVNDSWGIFRNEYPNQASLPLYKEAFEHGFKACFILLSMPEDPSD